MGGKKKETGTTIVNEAKNEDTAFSQQATATPQEQAENERQQGIISGRAGGTESAFNNAINLINQALTGGNLPGFLSGLPGGISPETIGTEASRVASRAQPGFQSLGIADSGVAFRETAREVGESVLFPAEAFNIQNLLNIANLGLSGQSAVEGQQQARESNLGSRLAGLRQISGTGSSNSTGSKTTQTLAPNPFLGNVARGALSGAATGFASGGPFGALVGAGVGAGGGAVRSI